jgi:diadenosine tetraphosphate (Ap4A) HIT family hydrolase
MVPALCSREYTRRVTRDWRADPVGAALRGEHPLVLARMRSGFATIGASQFLPGYSVLLTADPSADHLTDLDLDRRRDFLVDLALLGEAVETACRGADFRRINYEVLGNASAFLHAHVHPRYAWEPAEFRNGPVWCYPKAVRTAPEHAYSDERHGELRARIAAELRRLSERA